MDNSAVRIHRAALLYFKPHWIKLILSPHPLQLQCRVQNVAVAPFCLLRSHHFQAKLCPTSSRREEAPRPERRDGKWNESAECCKMHQIATSLEEVKHHIQIMQILLIPFLLQLLGRKAKIPVVPHLWRWCPFEHHLAKSFKLSSAFFSSSFMKNNPFLLYASVSAGAAGARKQWQTLKVSSVGWRSEKAQVHRWHLAHVQPLHRPRPENLELESPLAGIEQAANLKGP